MNKVPINKANLNYKMNRLIDFDAKIIYRYTLIFLIALLSTILIENNLQWKVKTTDCIIIKFNKYNKDAVQLFYNIGNGFNENDSAIDFIHEINNSWVAIFKLPNKKISEIRLDPKTSSGEIRIERFTILSKKKSNRVDLNQFDKLNDCSVTHQPDGSLLCESSGNDPSIKWSPKKGSITLNKNDSKIYNIILTPIPSFSTFSIVFVSICILARYNIKKIKGRSMLILFLFLGIFYISNCWTPSSYGCALKWMGIYNTPSFGESRPIRSDEWCVFTPTVQATVNNHYKRFNETSIYHDDLRVNWGMPIFDWGLIFKPYYWGFLILPPPYAFSFYYYFNFCAFVFLLALIFKEFGYTQLEGILYGLALYLSPGIQFWWNSNAPSFSIFPWIVYSLLICSEKKHGYYILFYSLVSWCMGHFYPPFIYSFLLLGFAFVLISGKYKLKTRNILFCGFSAVLGFILVFLYLRDYLSIINHTAYPGQRSCSGLDRDIWMKIQSFIIPNVNITPNYELVSNLGVHNICSISIVATIFPLLVLSFGKINRHLTFLDKTRKNYLEIILGCVISIILFLWVLVPIPSAFARFILLDKIQPERVTLALSFIINIFMIFSCVCLKWNISLIKIILFWGFYFILLFVYNREAHCNETSIISIAILLLAMCLLKISNINSRLLIAICTMLFGLTYFFAFNPLQSAKSIFEKHDTPVTREIENDVRAFGVTTVSAPGAVINGLGYPSISHVTIIPAIEFWKRKFPNMNLKECNIVFNRYGHVQLDNKNTISNPQSDVISIPKKYFSGNPLEPIMDAQWK